MFKSAYIPTRMDDDKMIRYCKIIIAIKQVLTLTLRDLLSKKIPPKDIFQRVSNGTKKQKENVKNQMPLIEAAANEEDYSSLDITLLYSLLRNFTDVSEPTDGWRNEPKDGFIRLGDDIERIRHMRNNCVHGPFLNQLSLDKFEEIRTNMIGICDRMTKHIGGDLNYSQCLHGILRRDLSFNDKLKAQTKRTVEHLRQDQLQEIISRKRKMPEIVDQQSSPKRLRTSPRNGSGSAPDYAGVRAAVLRQLKETCSTKNLQKPKSILLVGPAGVGKSSFINSSIAAMTGKYCPYAKSGCGENVTAENNVIRCSKYGDGKTKDLFLPTFVDMIGLDKVFSPDNDKPEEWLADEMLESLIDGKFPENTDLWSYAKRRMENCVPVDDSNVGVFIDIIVMVWAPKSGNSLHEKVIECINRQRDFKGQDIPVFVVLSKMDECDVQMEDLKTTKKYICEQLKIENSHILECVNYIDNLGWNNDFHSEIPMLQFLNKICNKGYERKSYNMIEFEYRPQTSSDIVTPMTFSRDLNLNVHEVANHGRPGFFPNEGDRQHTMTDLTSETELPSSSGLRLRTQNTGSGEVLNVNSSNDHRGNKPYNVTKNPAALSSRSRNINNPHVKDRGYNNPQKERGFNYPTVISPTLVKQRAIVSAIDSSKNRVQSTSPEDTASSTQALPLCIRVCMFVCVVLILSILFLSVLFQRS
ncbi:uncharacterized protein LOC125675389 [Ostrea edulis]|uniref:uncharacterized protein LOC125675389 n=1 Tax=Ostrea edulis TaxID=37623 RepID=UPI0020947E84|nr:uncharacterized protein LOC125675389 [Ostrea edulis]